ncbi:hypothetical protein EJ06DRAFT_532960 [Trichodelitschia bisporula]|uniref:DASH complex subunit SPC19 n=1 Tax=Trichodelitschia bisporula TaxID=703511 RepID=A0A6G1HMP6_9PEZI|nr:hypothetical protein EJ06DRAFT_532960 [Trichodelitschia bisporula]
MSLLNSSITTLDAGVNDFPRLSKVLQTTRHFELIAEPDLHQAQSALLSEIQPEVTNLLSRVAAYLDKLERREQSLIAKYELQEGRLSASGPAPRPSSRASKAGREPGAPLSGLDALRLKQMRQKKERLSFAIDRLQLQAGQRERQLRKSMAAPMDFGE